MSRVEGAECQDYDECEAGVGRASGFRPLTLPHSSALFDTRRRVCKMKLWAFLIRRPIWPPLQSKSTCHRGGIGRRAWFRSMYRQRCGGSSPFDGTKSLFFPPLLGLIHFSLRPTRGLHSCAASRLGSIYLSASSYPAAPTGLRPGHTAKAAIPRLSRPGGRRGPT